MLQSAESLTQRAMRVLQLAYRTHPHNAAQVSAQALALAELVSEHLPTGFSAAEADSLVAAAMVCRVNAAHLITLDEVLARFGPQVHAMVRMAAELQPPADDHPGHQQYCERLSQAPPGAKTIKLAQLFLTLNHPASESSVALDKTMRYLLQVRALAGVNDGLYSRTYSMVLSHLNARD